MAAYLVHGRSTTAEDLAGVAVAEDVRLLVLLELDVPLVVAAMALALVCSHAGWYLGWCKSTDGVDCFKWRNDVLERGDHSTLVLALLWTLSLLQRGSKCKLV